MTKEWQEHGRSMALKHRVLKSRAENFRQERGTGMTEENGENLMGEEVKASE